MRNTKAFRKLDCIKFLYFALVRSGLEYASQIWSPHQPTYIFKIERVQKMFTRFLYYKLNLAPAPYNLRLQHLKFLSLEKRRLLLDMSFFYKLVRNECDVGLLHELQFRIATFNSRSRLLFQRPPFRTEVGRFMVPLNRLQSLYNDNFNSVDIFDLSRSAFGKAVFYLLLEA